MLFKADSLSECWGTFDLHGLVSHTSIVKAKMVSRKEPIQKMIRVKRIKINLILDLNVKARSG